jgi:hypothetical protein
MFQQEYREIVMPLFSEFFSINNSRQCQLPGANTSALRTLSSNAASTNRSNEKKLILSFQRGEIIHIAPLLPQSFRDASLLVFGPMDRPKTLKNELNFSATS